MAETEGPVVEKIMGMRIVKKEVSEQACGPDKISQICLSGVV